VSQFDTTPLKPVPCDDASYGVIVRVADVLLVGRPAAIVVAVTLYVPTHASAGTWYGKLIDFEKPGTRVSGTEPMKRWLVHESPTGPFAARLFVTF
jgi:hypothetical protein